MSQMFLLLFYFAAPAMAEPICFEGKPDVIRRTRGGQEKIYRTSAFRNGRVKLNLIGENILSSSCAGKDVQGKKSPKTGSFVFKGNTSALESKNGQYFLNLKKCTYVSEGGLALFKLTTGSCIECPKNDVSICKIYIKKKEVKVLPTDIPDKNIKK